MTQRPPQSLDDVSSIIIVKVNVSVKVKVKVNVSVKVKVNRSDCIVHWATEPVARDRFRKA